MVRELPDRTAAPSRLLVMQYTAKAGSGNSVAVLRIGLVLLTLWARAKGGQWP